MWCVCVNTELHDVILFLQSQIFNWTLPSRQNNSFNLLIYPFKSYQYIYGRFVTSSELCIWHSALFVIMLNWVFQFSSQSIFQACWHSIQLKKNSFSIMFKITNRLIFKTECDLQKCPKYKQEIQWKQIDLQ